MKNKSMFTEEHINQQTKEKQELKDRKNKEIAEKNAMEKLFSGSCCHSGIHAYNPKKNI